MGWRDVVKRFSVMKWLRLHSVTEIGGRGGATSSKKRFSAMKWLRPLGAVRAGEGGRCELAGGCVAAAGGRSVYVGRGGELLLAFAGGSPTHLPEALNPCHQAVRHSAGALGPAKEVVAFPCTTAPRCGDDSVLNMGAGGDGTPDLS